MRRFAIYTILASLLLPVTAQAETLGFRFRPLYILVGVVDVNLDLPLGEKLRFSVGAAGGTVDDDKDDEELKVAGFGLDLTYHFDGPFAQGWYVGGYTGGASFEYENTADNSAGEVDITTFGAVGGYQWMWESFYMSLDARLGVVGGDKEIVVKNATTGVDTGLREDVPTTSANIAYKIGWRF